MLLMPGLWIVFWAGVLGFANAITLILALALPSVLSAPDDVHRTSAGDVHDQLQPGDGVVGHLRLAVGFDAYAACRLRPGRRLRACDHALASTVSREHSLSTAA